MNPNNLMKTSMKVCGNADVVPLGHMLTTMQSRCKIGKTWSSDHTIVFVRDGNPVKIRNRALESSGHRRGVVFDECIPGARWNAESFDDVPCWSR